MTKYVCYGDCGGESDTPGVCQTDSCNNYGKSMHAVEDEDEMDDDLDEDEDEDGEVKKLGEEEEEEEVV